MSWPFHLALAPAAPGPGLRRARCGSLSASYLVATFFNNFLPSNIGGDIVRVRDSSQITGSTTASLAVVAVDRILGFGALYLLALAAFAGRRPRAARPGRARARCSCGLGPCSSACSAYVFFRPGTARPPHGRRPAWPRSPGLRERFEVVQAAVHVYRRQLAAVFTAFGASVALQALVVRYFYRWRSRCASRSRSPPASSWCRSAP